MIILLFILFAFYDYGRKLKNPVISILTPALIQIDFNNNKLPDENEKICIPDIEVLSANMEYNFDNVAKSLGINKTEALSLGYMADGFAEKVLADKPVKVKFNGEKNRNCRFADILIDNKSYGKLLSDSRYAFKDGKPLNEEKYTKNLEKARKLKLVILNHRSNKYHKLDCKYGLAAHDSIIIQRNQLPKDAQKCKFCFINELNDKHAKEVLSSYPLIISSGKVKLYLTDFTKTLKPDAECKSIVCKTVLNEINNSSKSIDMAIYGWDKNPVLNQAIKKAKQRGVKIRLVYDDSYSTGKYAQNTKELVELSDVTKNDLSSDKQLSKMLMHNKFIIFDGKKVFTGSMNYSITGLSGFNSNCLITIDSPEIAKKYTHEFEQMLMGKFHINKNKLPVTTYYIDNMRITPLFSPKDKIITDYIIPLIENSESYIYIPAFLVTHTAMTESLIKAKRRGVDVRIIVDATNNNRNYFFIKRLRSGNIPVKFENYAGKMHMKTIIIDDKYVIAGSMNFSNAGENKNDENSLIMESPRLAKYYKGFFKYTWDKIPEKYLKGTIRAEGKYSIGSCSDGIDNNFDEKIDLNDEGCKP